MPRCLFTQNPHRSLTELTSPGTTAKSISPSSTDEEKAAAQPSIEADVADMVDAIKAATAKVPAASDKLLKRQVDPTALSTLMANVIAALSNVADDIIAALGLSKENSFRRALSHVG